MKRRRRVRYGVAPSDPKSHDPRDHTWDVVDRWNKDKVIASFSLRATARDEAAELNRINKEPP